MAEHEPLGKLWVGEGVCAIRHKERGTLGWKYYGPFLNPDVSHAWGCDAFGRSEQNKSWEVIWFDQPWTVPADERKP